MYCSEEDSRLDYYIDSLHDLAQSYLTNCLYSTAVVQGFCKAKVGGSNPSGGMSLEVSHDYKRKVCIAS